MKNLIKTEELLLFFLCIYLFINLDYNWWVFPLTLLLPDIGMIGYVLGDKWGSYIYNFFHLKTIAIALILLGGFLEIPFIILAGVIMLAHSSIDRVLGYGLKYTTGFKNTHMQREF